MGNSHNTNLDQVPRDPAGNITFVWLVMIYIFWLCLEQVACLMEAIQVDVKNVRTTSYTYKHIYKVPAYALLSEIDTESKSLSYKSKKRIK